MTGGSLDARALALLDDALEQPSAEREAWITAHCGGDEELRDRALSLLRAGGRWQPRTGAGPLDFVREEMPERIGAYRITGLIGQGGMGAVYRGERAAGDFDHVAAIKLIRPGALSDTLIERFQRERQTLASLSHPHIARLFDGGATANGDPYIVMEYVDGQPLGAWLAETDAGKRERSRLFLEIGAAVGFAHQNLIVHRDITTSNVLVTRDGDAKLIDFGIARPPAQPDTPSQPSRRSLEALSLTPGFAAPERLAGAPATTLSDIYSLGVLLERMLGGSMDADLKAIILKATAAEPSERYPSADALADDVRAWRDDDVVAARNGGRAYAISKFVARHRLGVAAASVAIVLLVSALIVTLLANNRAEAARAEAEHRFAETRSIANTLLFDAFDEVSRTPGSTRAREMLARTGLKYLDALAADRDAPLDLRIEAGRGYTRLADVVGGGQASQLGKYADANQLLSRADAVLSDAYRSAPSNPEVIRAYAGLRLEQSGANLYNNNEIALARSQAREVQKLVEPLAGEDAESARLYAVALQAEGDSYGWEDKWPEAEKRHAAAEAFMAGLPETLQRDREVMMARSGNLRLLGEAQHKLKQTDAARASLERAVAFNEALVEAEPDDPTLLRKLSASLWYSAVVHRTNERDALAAESIDRAFNVARRLRDRDPNDAGGLQMFAVTGEVRAQVLGDLGRYAESYATGDEVIESHRRLVTLAGDAPGAKRSMATALSTIGGNHYNGGDINGACVAWRQALAVFEDIDRRGALAETDRKNGVPELRDYLRRACEGGLRPGALGPKV